MRRTGRARLALAALMTFGAWSLVTLSSTSSAVVTAVRGEAYGYFASVSLFGGPPMTRGPEPIVTLAPDASNSPQDAQLAQGLVQFGPATLFSTDQITVHTDGSTGAGGSVHSNTTLNNINRSGQEVFTASSASSNCTASEAGVSGSTTINNGVLQTSQGDPDVEGDETNVNVPTNPAPGTAFNGTIESVGDSFQFIFNEQILDTNSADGSISIIVYAGHLRLLGPTAVGDLYFGKSECGVTGTQFTSSTSSSSPTSSSSSTSTSSSTSSTTSTSTSTSTTSTSTTSTSTTTSSTTTTTRPTTTSSSTTTTRPTTTSSSTTTTAVGPPTCGGAVATIVGTNGDDTIIGTAGPDVIVGLGGNDSIRGLGGNDRICGGSGNDLIDGGDGNDRLFGQDGNDRLLGGSGSNVLKGGAGSDQCFVTPTSTATDCEQVLAQP